MYRVVVIFICISQPLLAFGHDDDFWKQQIVELTKRLQEQDQRMLRLEQQLLLQQPSNDSGNQVIIVSKPVEKVEAPTPKWLLPASWQALKPGMSRVEVEAILGIPSAEQKDILDNVTLIYRSSEQNDQREGKVIITHVNRVEFRGILPPEF